jgi:hypothetical protein
MTRRSIKLADEEARSLIARLASIQELHSRKTREGLLVLIRRVCWSSQIKPNPPSHYSSLISITRRGHGEARPARPACARLIR